MIRIQNTEERFLYYSGRTGLYRVDTEKDKHLPFKFTNKKRFGGEGLSPDTGGEALRLVPANSNQFYIVRKEGSGGEVIKFRRNTGGSADATNIGVKWPEWRICGLGTIAAYTDDPATATTWQGDNNGAWDFVIKATAGGFFFSYHGLGAGGSLDAETVKIDGVVIDPAVAKSGLLFDLQNTVTASNGTDIATRTHTTRISSIGTTMSTDALSLNGSFEYAYPGMAIGSSLAYDEVHQKLLGSFSVHPLGNAEAEASLLDAREVRVRNSTTGDYITISSDLPTRTGFVEARVDKEMATSRAKIYLGKFTSFVSLVGAAITLKWGRGASGPFELAPNLIADPAWGKPPWDDTHTSVGSITRNAGDLTMTCNGGGASNLRTNAPIVGCVTGQRYTVSIDKVSSSGSVGNRSVYIGASASSTAGAALALVDSKAPITGRTIAVFYANQSDPNQRLLLRQESNQPYVTTYRNPSVRLSQ